MKLMTLGGYKLNNKKEHCFNLINKKKSKSLVHDQLFFITIIVVY